jgi:hypothetical protein
LVSREGNMINLQERVSQIILNNPESVLPLLDVLIFMAMKNATLSAEYDESLEILYAKTADSRHHLKAFAKERAAAA